MSSKDGQARRLLFSGRLRSRQARWVLELACPSSFIGILLAVGKQEAEREAGTDRAANHHEPKLDAVSLLLAFNFGPGMRRPHGISIRKCKPVSWYPAFLTRGHTECTSPLHILTSGECSSFSKTYTLALLTTNLG